MHKFFVSLDLEKIIYFCAIDLVVKQGLKQSVTKLDFIGT